MKCLFVVLFLVSLTCGLSAQNQGKVSDSQSGEALIGVSISSHKDRKVISVTDEEGAYPLKNLSGLNDKDTLQFSHVGYHTRLIPLDDLKLLKYDVTMDEDVQSLREVTIAAQKQSPQILLQYEQRAPMPVGVHSFGSVLVNDKIYVSAGDVSYIEDIGLKALADISENPTGAEISIWGSIRPNSSWSNHSDKILIYDIRKDTWETSSVKTRKRAYHNSNYSNGKIYSFGGKRLSTNRKFEYLDETIEAFDISRDTIFKSNLNPHQSINFASIVFDDNIIVMGGSVKKNVNDQKVYSDKAYLFNLTTGYWYQLDDMPVSKETKGIVVDNTVYLIGGYKGGPLKDIESYNLAVGEWTKVGSLLRKVERPGLTYHAGIIYIFEEGRIQTYNVETKEVNLYMVDLLLHSAELFYADSKLYVVGGFRKDEYTVEPSPDVYSIELEQFRKTRTYNEQ